MKKDQWKLLNDKQRWDIITAMRGPDLTQNGDMLKYFTTAVIRNEMREVLRPLGTSALLNDKVRMVVAPYPMPSATQAKQVYGMFDLRHFITHVTDAAQIIGVPILWVPTDAWMKGLLNFSAPPTIARYWVRAIEEAANTPILAPSSHPLIEEMKKVFGPPQSTPQFIDSIASPPSGVDEKEDDDEGE